MTNLKHSKERKTTRLWPRVCPLQTGILPKRMNGSISFLNTGSSLLHCVDSKPGYPQNKVSPLGQQNNMPPRRWQFAADLHGTLTHFAMQSTVDLNWHYRFNGGLGPVANVCRWGGGKNYSHATASLSLLSCWSELIGVVIWSWSVESELSA